MTKTALGPDEPEWSMSQEMTPPEWRILVPFRFVVYVMLWATWTTWRVLALVCAIAVLAWLVT